MKEFRDVLRELRQKEGLSQESLSNIIHVSRSAIAKYENGLGSEEVIQSLCEHFKVDRDYMFPKENVEDLIVKKNLIIKNQKRKLLLIVSCLLLIIIILVCILIINKRNKKEVNLENISLSINMEDYTSSVLETAILKDYKGGYVIQRIETHKYEFTATSNLYLIRVFNTYVNGNMAYTNDNKYYKSSEYTESTYMGMNFTYSQNYCPITSWDQKHSFYFTLNSKLDLNSEILLKENMNLYGEACIQKRVMNFYFIMNQA